jgi:hypothetical protein
MQEILACLAFEVPVLRHMRPSRLGGSRTQAYCAATGVAL